MRRSRFAPFASALIALGAALQPAGAAPLPTVTVTGVTAAGRGMTKPFFADSDGRRWIFKRDDPVETGIRMRSGNFEAEYVADGVFRALEIPAPRVQAVRIEGREGVFLRVELVDERMCGGAKVGGAELTTGKAERDLPEDWATARAVYGAAPIRWSRVARIQLVDVLLHNYDRHEESFLFYPGADGRFVPVPIDHNLALGGANWDRDPIVTDPAERDPFDPGRGELAGAVCFDKSLITDAAARRPGAAPEYRTFAAEMVARLTDPVLTQIVREIPDEAITSDEPGARKAAILAALRARRDRLEAFVEGYFSDLAAGRLDDDEVPASD